MIGLFNYINKERRQSLNPIEYHRARGDFWQYVCLTTSLSWVVFVAAALIP